MLVNTTLINSNNGRPINIKFGTYFHGEGFYGIQFTITTNDTITKNFHTTQPIAMQVCIHRYSSTENIFTVSVSNKSTLIVNLSIYCNLTLHGAAVHLLVHYLTYLHGSLHTDI